MTSADFNLLLLVALGLLSVLGGWIWTRADRRRRTQQTERLP
jgi:hypothetical protein